MLQLVARHDYDVLRFAVPMVSARLGSSAANPITLPFSGVSRLHATLEPEGLGLRIRDEGSKNGLIVEGRRLPEFVLNVGGHVCIGTVVLTLEEGPSGDVELAFPIPSGSSGEPEVEITTSSRGGAGPAGSPPQALALVRRLEPMSPEEIVATRGALLRQAAGVLATESLAVLLVDASGAPALAVHAGALPAEGLLSRAIGKGQAKEGKALRSVRLLEGGRVLAVSSGDAALVAVFPEEAGEVAAWKRDLFGFLARTFLNTFTMEAAVSSKVARPSAKAGALRLPTDFVVGPSLAMSRFLESVRATVGSGFDVLLTGETGTGKELIARIIHSSGPTPGGPFVAINCAAIPNELLEAELFGVQRGAATGVEPRPGQFDRAHGGTILLDEIGELAEPLQAKLLRVVQERETLPLGASKPHRIDVRIVAVTNRALLERIREGKFRKDLYYRLRQLQFHVPPLRDRKDDIPELVLAFAVSAARQAHKLVRGVSRSALDLLLAHDWPGNVRELETEVRRAVLMSPHGGTLQSEHFGSVTWAADQGRRLKEAAAAALAAAASAASLVGPAAGAIDDADLDLEKRRDAVDRETIQRALHVARGNRSHAARLLKISRNGLATRMKELGIEIS
jgi:DNA-binding NtrC family response regulator